MSKKPLAIGNDDFKDLIENNCYYVDQTKLIEELREKKSKVVLFPRPRRFGKSLNISMLENFFDIELKDRNKNLFKGLYISKSEYYKELNTYPLISVDFKNLKQNTFSSVYNQFVMLMQDLYNNKDYLFDNLKEGEKEYYTSIQNGTGNIDDYKNSISRLISFLSRYYNKKVILLIDEYDVPIQQGYLEGFYDDIIDLIRTMFSSALKGNDNLAFAVMTGVLRVSKESIFSDLNNVDVYGLYNSNFGEYFGFKEGDTKELLNYYDLDLTSEVREMYDGYNFNGVNIYNPWSIINYANRKIFATFWVNTSGNDLIKKILFNTNEDNKKVIENLVQGKKEVFTYNEKLTYLDFDNYDDRNIILNLLFSSGYLTIDEEIDVKNAYIKLPNREVKDLISGIMAESILESRSYLTYDIMKCIESFDLQGLEKILNQMLTYSSYMDSKEAFYHGYMLGLFSDCLLNSKYIIKSNRESGLGRCDIMIERVDKSFGYIFEFKVVDDDDMGMKAFDALKQIEDKEYYLELINDKIKDIHKVSIVFRGKKCIVKS